MNKRPSNPNPTRARGITLIEALVVLGVLALLLSFAMPSVSTSADRAELRATTENVQFSLDAARRMARMNESPVQVIIPAAREGHDQTLSFAFVTRDGNHATTELQDYTLPGAFLLITERDHIVFDARGLPDSSEQILLVSREDESLKSIININ